jgi:hypothetical protein
MEVAGRRFVSGKEKRRSREGRVLVGVTEVTSGAAEPGESGMA